MGVSSTKVLLLDDDDVLRRRLERQISAQPNFEVVGSVSDPSKLPTYLDFLQPDVVLVGIELIGLEKFGDPSEWSRSWPRTKFIVLSPLPSEPFAKRTINAGAHGYLHQYAPLSVLLESINAVVSGELVVWPRVSDRRILQQASEQRPNDSLEPYRFSGPELQLLTLSRQGKGITAIAAELHLSSAEVYSLTECVAFKLSLQLRHDSLMLRARSSRSEQLVV